MTGRHLAITVGLIVGATAVAFTQATNIHTSDTLPTNCTVGNVYLKTSTSAGFYICLATDTWTGPLAAGSGAPTDAEYWVGAADGTLSAEHDLSALSTGLVLNTAGTPSAYAGDACDSGDFATALDGSGVLTCDTPAGGGGGALSDITAATGSASINNAGHNIVWNWSLDTPAEIGFRVTENVASSGNTAYLASFETIASSSAVPLKVVHEGSNNRAFQVFDDASDTTPFAVAADGSVNINCNNGGVGTGGGDFQLNLCGVGSHGIALVSGANNLWLQTNGSVWNWRTTTAVGQAFQTANTTRFTIVSNDYAVWIGDNQIFGTKLSSTLDGQFSITVNGNGNDEGITVDLDNVANTAAWSSATGVSLWTFTASLQPAGYNAADGSAGVTVTSCTQFEEGICTAGTAPAMTMDALIAEVVALRQEIAMLRAETGR